METIKISTGLADALVTCVGSNAREYARRVPQTSWTSEYAGLQISIDLIAQNTAEPMLFALGCPACQRALILKAAATYAYYVAREEVFPGNTATRMRVLAREEFYQVLDLGAVTA
jgi:hypothetical protein